MKLYIKLRTMKFSKLIQGACVLLLVLVSTQVIAQDDATGDAVKELSKNKWQWMSDKNMDKLTALFHPQAQFVHMGGSWGTDRELEIIKNGFIWYKKADIQDGGEGSFYIYLKKLKK